MTRNWSQIYLSPQDERCCNSIPELKMMSKSDQKFCFYTPAETPQTEINVKVMGSSFLLSHEKLPYSYIDTRYKIPCANFKISISKSSCRSVTKVRTSWEVYHIPDPADSLPLKLIQHPPLMKLWNQDLLDTYCMKQPDLYYFEAMKMTIQA